MPEDYLRRPHTPASDEEAPESEWGFEPTMLASVAEWCARRRHPLVELCYQGPQAVAHPVAELFRRWTRSRGEPAQTLAVPSFVLGDPWQTINAAAVPFWTFFAVQPALAALEAHVRASEPYRDAHVFLFEHGAESRGIARPEEWLEVVRRSGAAGHLAAVDPDRFPHDIGSLAGYGPAFRRLPPAARPWSPLAVEEALDALRAAGMVAGG